MMKHARLVIIALFACLAGPAAAPTANSAAWASEPARRKAVVEVTIRVMPYAEVVMDASTVDVELPPGASSGQTAHLGGTIRTNVSATVYTRITKPAGAPGEWTVEPEVRQVNTPGEHRFEQLLRITVWDVPSWFTGHVFTIEVNSPKVQNPSQITTPPPGSATITVIPN